VVDKLIALGVISVADMDDVGVKPLISELKIESDLAHKLVAAAAKEVERLAEKSKQQETQEQPAQETEASDSK